MKSLLMYYPFILVFIAILFYQLKSRDTPVLLAMIIVTIWGYYVYQEWQKRDEIQRATDKTTFEKLTEIPTEYGNKALPLVPVDAHFLPKQNTRYLKYNSHLVEILKDLAFTKMFDKARYYHLVLLMDRYQKTYIYLLIQRYRIQEGVPIFYDLYESILEQIYSMAVNVPLELKHTYGLNTHERIQAQIQGFKGLFKTMVTILRNYAELELKLPYFPEWIPASANGYTERKNVLP